MALWNKVSSGFNTDDETVNFGARTVAENNGSIYETSTLATIQSDGQVITNPKVSASIQYSMLCVAVDKSITIFNDESCHEIVLSIGFDSLITAYCLSKDCSFLLIALADGVLHCLHIASGGKQAFYQNIEEKFGDIVVKIFLEEDEEKTDILLVGKSGSIYSIKEFNINAVHKALINDNEGSSEEIENKIECTEIFKGTKTIEAACIDPAIIPDQSTSIITIGRDIQIWPSGRRSGLFSALPYEYKKIQLFKNYGAMICLRSDGGLSVVCSETLLGRKLWNGPVADFVTVQDKINDPYQIVILKVPENGSATTTLQFFSFPEFEIKFEIKVPTTTYLVDLVGCSLENIVFLEGIENVTGKIDTIRVKAIVESIPEYRLQRLLRREQFEEAEFFAKQFKLTLESVHRAKAAAFINKLGPWTDKSDNAAQLEAFVSTLNEINDVRYIYDCCNNALTSNYKQTSRLLMYARQRIMQNIRATNSHEYDSLLTTLDLTLRKLETFEIIEKIKIKSEIEKRSEDVEEWITFSRSNLLEETIKHLSLGELEAAATIWIRHLPEMARLITSNSIDEILQSISESIAPEKLWPWLCHFVPSVISLMPSVLDQIISWGYKKTKTLEKCYRKEWPQNGLDFAKGLMDLFSFQESGVCINFHQQYANKNSNLHHLITLIKAMTDLLELKTQHRIVVPLEIYLSDPVNVIHLLLNKSHVEEIPKVIENFLQNYILKNSLQNDQVYCTYVQKTLRNSKDWWFWEKAPWEQRVSVIIGYIDNVQNRLQQTLDVLKKAPVPWSETVTALAESCYNFDHPLVSKIRTESNGVAVKLILKKYGYAHIGLCTRFFQYIVKQDRADMLDDIRELTKADINMRSKAFCLCIHHHLRHRNLEKAMEIFRLVDDDIIARRCCEEIINVTISALRLMDRYEWLGCYVGALGTVQDKLEQIIPKTNGDSLRFHFSYNSIPHLKRIYKLDRNCSVRTDLERYRTQKDQILIVHIDQLLNDVETGTKTILECCKSVEKVAELLELPILESSIKFFQLANDVDILERSITRLHETGITTEEEFSNLHKLCSDWIVNSNRDPVTAEILKEICAANLAHCQSDQLHEALLCSNSINAYMPGLGNYVKLNALSDHRKNSESEYILYTIYKDAGVASGEMLLTMYKASLSLFNFYAGKSRNQDSRARYIEEGIDLIVKNLLIRMRSIQNDQHDFALMRNINYLYYTLASLSFVGSEVMKESRSFFTQSIFTLLRKIVCARAVDFTLGLVCLFLVTEAEATKWLSTACRTFQSDYTRHRIVIELGYEYNRIIKNSEQLYTFECQKVLHRWARRLTNYGISYKEMMTSNMEGKRNILERVMKSKKPNLLHLVNEFSVDFGFELNDCYLLYLQVLMSDWQPRLTFSTSSGRKELKINENDVDELYLRCKEVAANIDDLALLKKHLTQLSPQINFYHYEVFLIMLELLAERNTERIEHFYFLQNYTRYGEPTKYEIDEWAAICHENSNLPPISQWRLPFLPKIDQWKLITPELNLKTYEKWLTIAPVLKLQSHLICTLAIKGSVAEAWKSSSNDRNRNDSWCLYPRNSALLKEIKRCILCMTGPESLQYGTAALYYVFNHTPQGADQVAAAKECYISAQIWERQSDKPDTAMIEKIKDKYLRLTSKHILHTHGLGEERYLSLIGYPEKLIRELYNDESIPERCKGAIKRCPNINSAANDLGKIFSLNMMKIRFDLLLDWLQPDTWEGRANDSITMGFGTSAGIADESPNAEENLLRACYILGSGETTLYANFLINIAFDEKEDSHRAGVRVRALRVLESITDENTLKDLTKRDPESVRRYMKSLQYIDDLESLGLGYTISGFDACSKQKLAQILLKNQCYTPRALSLILQICLDFKVDDYALLNATLERMAKQSMVKDLEKALPMIGMIGHMSNSSGYIVSWQVVISDPFGRLDPRPSQSQICDCVKSLRLLHACRVAAKLEFRDVINRCFRCHQAHLAAAFLPFLKERDRAYVFQEIRENFPISEVMSELRALVPKGILVASQALMMLQDELLPIKKIETT